MLFRSSPVVAGAVGEGLMGAGSAAENLRERSADELLSGRDIGAAVGSGIGTAALGLVGGKLAERFGVADPDTLLAGGLKALKAPSANKAEALTKDKFLKQMVGAGISEGVFEEMPQSAQEQMWANFANDKPIAEGVPEAMASGLITGGVMGGVGGGYTQYQLPQTTTPPPPPEQETPPETTGGVNIMTPTVEALTPEARRYMEELAQKEKSATVKDWLGSEHEGSKLYKSLMEQDFTTHEGLDEVERLLNGPDAQLNTRGLKIAEQDIAKHREAIGAQEQQQAAAQQEDETRSSQISEAANVPGVATPAVPQEHIDTAQAALDTISQAPKLPSATPAPLIRAAKNLGVSVTNMPVAQAIDTVQTRLNELQPQGVSNAPTALTELGRPATGTTGAMGSSGVGSGVGYTAEPAVVERPPVEPAGSNVSDAVRRTGEPNAALELPTTDSTGKDIHPTSEGIKNFWNWFGDSKAVDDAGKPLVVYHGTDPNSEEGFSQFKEGVNYFTPRSDYSYVKNGKYVYPAYVNIKNPYRPANQSEIEQIRNNPERVEELKKAGYDSMLWSQPNNIMRGASGWGNDFPQIVTFYPNQVKSATGNTGEFNQGKPDITASKVEPISNEAVPDEEFTPDQTREEFAGKLGIANAGNYIQQPRSEKLKQAYSWLKGQAFVGKHKKRNVYRDISMGHALNALSTSTNPFIKHIAEQANDKLKHIGFNFNKILKHPRAGVYSRYPGENGFRVPGRETITLHGEHTNDEHTLAHEVIHGFTATAIDYPTEAQKPTIQKLNKLYNTVKDHPLIRGRYGATDVHEFVAEGMSKIGRAHV